MSDDMRAWIGLVTPGTWAHEINGTVTVDTPTFELQATFHVTEPIGVGVVNILSLADTTIEPVSTGRVLPGLYPADLGDPEPAAVHIVAIEREFHVNDYVYRVTVTVPHAGSWPVVASLATDTATLDARVDIVVT